MESSSPEWVCRTSDTDHCIALGSMIKQVYGGGGNQPLGEHGHILLDSLSLENLDDFIEKELRKSVVEIPSIHSISDLGIIGPHKVIFDVSSNVGSLVIDKDRLGLSSQSNFSSIRANCCVYKGRWQYELMLGSKGVMQVGWATINCKFSQEKGVGDTPHSYAYDGHRVRKWNVSTYKYGESWLTGDVIGCTIDLDNGIVEFYRNGKYLGEAFENVQVGPGTAYFPAVSLAYNENLAANFGSTPMRYPQDGFSPLQEYPEKDVAHANKLLSWMEKLLELYNVSSNESSSVLVVRAWPLQYRQGVKGQVLLIAAPLMHRLGPLLSSAFITEGCLLPFLFELYKKDQNLSKLNSKSYVASMLEIMWALMEPHELHQCLEYIVVALLTGYRFSPSAIEFTEQKKYLNLTLALLQHTATKHYLLQNVLFDKIKFPVFLEVKPFDNAVLSEVVPEVWLDFKQEMNEEEHYRKSSYQKSCTHLKQIVKGVELIQLAILLELFDWTDVYQGQCSRCIFLAKFREFLKENSGGTRVPVVHLCPLPVALAFFHHLVSLLRICVSASGIDINTLSVPSCLFYDNSISYKDIQRVGGLQSHLLKTYQDIVFQEISSKEKVPLEKEPIKFGKVFKSDKVRSQHCDVCHSNDKDNLSTLIELLDGIIRLYHIAAHRQLEKMCALRDSMHEYRHALKDLDKRFKLQKGDVEHELNLAKQVFLCKLIEQGRHQAWITAVVYSSDRQTDVFWLLQILLRTLSKASDTGVLFSFVPDFYVEACIKCCHALRNYFPPVSPLENILCHREVLIQYGSFLAHHFSDERVVNAELKDSLVQALASYVCYPTTLQALESMDVESRLVMTRALLQPYENRAWAQSNWILIRLWKGCGFSFRYSISPHMARKMSYKSIPITDAFQTNSQKPCPSPVFLEHVSEHLLENSDTASTFMSSVLNQLNWAFSEFIGMLQEIQNASNRPERIFIDARQLKICATCFDLALGLLRVLEMTVHLVPQLFTDSAMPSAEIFLTRLCQLVCQVLNRVTSKSGCFCLIANMEIPGLETIDHFPILTAVAGILVSLIIDGEPQNQEKAINALLAEPSFQPTSLDFLLGSSPEVHGFKTFSLRDYKEVNKDEIAKLESLVQLLHARYAIAQKTRSLEEIDEEVVCTICYANQKSAMFYPCQHQSCRSCISLHLLSHRECFFCKAVIDYIQPLTSEKHANK